MGWRVVAVKSRSKLDFKMNYLVCRTDSSVSKVYIDEIDILIIESTAVSLTAVLLNKLIDRNIKVIFCDDKRNPSAELTPYYGCHDTSLKIRNQVKWSDLSKALVWTEIVRKKVENQRDILKKYGFKQSDIIDGYLFDFELNDSTNREGHAAKVYFNTLYGQSFSRNRENNINSALNYGYALILSAVNREITALGYITQLGIFHRSMFNEFNLGSDIMEPLRGIIDSEVYRMDLEKFSSYEKDCLKEILTKEVSLNGKNYIFTNAISIYVKSILDALDESNLDLIRFIDYEL